MPVWPRERINPLAEPAGAEHTWGEHWLSKDQAVSIEIAGLRREFKTKTAPVIALDGVSLNVNQGEIFGVLGPNGAARRP